MYCAVLHNMFQGQGRAAGERQSSKKGRDLHLRRKFADYVLMVVRTRHQSLGGVRPGMQVCSSQGLATATLGE